MIQKGRENNLCTLLLFAIPSHVDTIRRSPPVSLFSTCSMHAFQHVVSRLRMVWLSECERSFSSMIV